MPQFQRLRNTIWVTVLYIYICTHVRILCPDPQFNPMKSPLQLNPMKCLPLDSWGYDFVAVAATASGADVGCARAGLWRLPEATRLAGRGQRSLAESHAPNQQIWYETMVSTGIISIVCKIRGDYLISTCSLLINMCTLVAKRLQAEAPTSSDMGIAHTKAIRIILTTFGASISDMSAVT